MAIKRKTNFVDPSKPSPFHPVYTLFIGMTQMLQAAKSIFCKVPSEPTFVDRVRIFLGMQSHSARDACCLCGWPAFLRNFGSFDFVLALILVLLIFFTLFVLTQQCKQCMIMGEKEQAVKPAHHAQSRSRKEE